MCRVQRVGSPFPRPTRKCRAGRYVHTSAKSQIRKKQQSNAPRFRSFSYYPVKENCQASGVQCQSISSRTTRKDDDPRRLSTASVGPVGGRFARPHQTAGRVFPFISLCAYGKSAVRDRLCMCALRKWPSIHCIEKMLPPLLLGSAQ